MNKTLEFQMTSEEVGQLRLFLKSQTGPIKPIADKMLAQFPPANKIEILKGMRELAAMQGIDLGLKQAKFMANYIVNNDDTAGLELLCKPIGT